MSDHSSNLLLPYIQPSQAQKHVTHNEALRRLDAIVQLTVQSFDASSPPADPADGDIHALGAGASGVWAGQDGMLAYHASGHWIFLAPKDGWRAWSAEDQTLRVFSAGNWLAVTPPLQNLDGIGVGTSSDTVNRLAIASDAALFSHAGSDHRLVINKATAADTASVVMQSGWSGRAELGLTGDEDFHIRTSPDGSAWTSALTLRRGDGASRARCLFSGTIDIDNHSVGYVPTPSAGGMVAINLVAEEFPQAPHSGLFSYDTGPSLTLFSLARGTSLEDWGTTVLTGTTATDGRSALAVRSGELQIENRHGGPRRFAYTFLNTY
ncbi:DUF2793 domain-containing protein [uncultured Roseovarius sp.]|uniref:DUF2793 domain-containing protein n=1 Tax=uncultured Roseovarius sp. TaxID=293344 RepID=UPI00262D45FB|nr:DUF2793 domain-containing protein [uncultured Roseovarius sp.]